MKRKRSINKTPFRVDFLNPFFAFRRRRQYVLLINTILVLHVGLLNILSGIVGEIYIPDQTRH